MRFFVIYVVYTLSSGNGSKKGLFDIKMQFVVKKMQKNLVNSKKSSNFAGFFV